MACRTCLPDGPSRPAHPAVARLGRCFSSAAEGMRIDIFIQHGARGTHPRWFLPAPPRHFSRAQRTCCCRAPALACGCAPTPHAGRALWRGIRMSPIMNKAAIQGQRPGSWKSRKISEGAVSVPLMQAAGSVYVFNIKRRPHPYARTHPSQNRAMAQQQ